MAFDYPERDRLNLRGLLPPRVKSFEGQVNRVMEWLRDEPDPVQQNLYLQDLHNTNETLYHKVVVDHIAEIAPLIYTPTVGQVCENFGHEFRRTRGMYFSRHDRGMMASMVYNWPSDRVDVIVVTDGSRILGLGDLGVHGMGIPIGKLALYCACGGIAPHRVLPVALGQTHINLPLVFIPGHISDSLLMFTDVGTNNEQFLVDKNYIGTQLPRLEGEEYFDMVEEFMQAVSGRWPGVVIQFEDFETTKAVPLLAKYRHKYRCFNDDIQGTGCVTLSGILAAARNAGTDITQMRVMCVGAGSAGLGVCTAIKDGMIQAGLTEEEAMKNFVVCAHLGALGKQDGTFGDPNYEDGLGEDVERGPWASREISDGMSLQETMETFKPTCL